MAYYLIHACAKRMWYVKKFLLPSMIEQGICSDNIFVYQDKNQIGNLRAWVDSCNKISHECMTQGIKGIWHLQDDVVICRDFKERTEKLSNTTLVCGFTCAYEKEPIAGMFKLSDEMMWYSFPCIYIPTYMLANFATWANLNLWQSEYFKPCVRRNNADDLVFREWLYSSYPNELELNLAPNLVNHIDDLINGSVVNPSRTRNTRSIFWEDESIVDDLKKALANYRNI